MKTMLDISKHQGGINLKWLTGVDGVIYRRCIGSSSLDPCFDSFCSQKEPIGLYVRSYAKDEPQEQPAKKKSILELIIDFIFALFEGK